jgi:phospholipase/lecithinase/hemolysin
MARKFGIRILVLAAVSVLLFVLLFQGALAETGVVPAHPTRIIVFGDSLSDTGNAYIGSLHSRAPSPPYYQGRFSNGPVWIEIFAEHFGLKVDPVLRGGTNFAVGGAKAGSGADSLPHQAELYWFLSIFSRPDPNALYVIFGGGNDVRKALKQPDPAAALAAAALDIRGMIENLAAWGAVNFLVPNVPNRGFTPAARERGTATREQALTVAFDTALDAALNDLPGRLRINLIRLDLWSLVEEAFAAPARWGFSDITDPCLTKRQSEFVACSNPSSYAFWDDIHPTTKGHQVIAAAALDAYRSAAGSPSPGEDEPPFETFQFRNSGTSALAPLQSEVLRIVQEHME